MMQAEQTEEKVSHGCLTIDKARWVFLYTELETTRTSTLYKLSPQKRGKSKKNGGEDVLLATGLHCNVAIKSGV